MITVRQIQRMWSGKSYERLLELLTAPRPEVSSRLLGQLLSHGAGSLPAAAMAVIRLDELAQSYVPFYSELVRTILNAQRPDGGWGDVMVTALCLRALMCGQGHGIAIDGGLALLAELQKPEGIWPAMPVRRMPADAFASAFMLTLLGDSEPFRQVVRLDGAMEWFESNELALDEETRKVWARMKRRSARAPRQISNTGPTASAASVSCKTFWDFSAALST